MILYKGKGGAHDRGDYCTLKFAARGTTNAIFFVCQFQEKFVAANNRLYFTFIELEKVFDHLPR